MDDPEQGERFSSAMRTDAELLYPFYIIDDYCTRSNHHRSASIHGVHEMEFYSASIERHIHPPNIKSIRGTRLLPRWAI